MRRSALALLLLAGCGGRYLKYDGDGFARSARVSVNVVDQRAAEKGGSDPRVIGSEAGAFNIPMDIRSTSPTEAADVLSEVLERAALDASGTAATNKITIEAEMTELWCAPTGALVSSAIFRGAISVTDAAHTAGEAQPIVVRDTGLNCARAYRHLLNRLRTAAAAAITTAIH